MGVPPVQKGRAGRPSHFPCGSYLILIPNYWIFNLVDNQLEMHSEPYRKHNGSFSYQLQRVVLPNQTVVIPGFPELSLDLAAVFPAQIGE